MNPFRKPFILVRNEEAIGGSAVSWLRGTSAGIANFPSMTPAALRFFLCLFCFGMATHGLATGAVIMKGRFSKTESPGAFWLAVSTYIGLGLFSLVLALQG